MLRPFRPARLCARVAPAIRRAGSPRPAGGFLAVSVVCPNARVAAGGEGFRGSGAATPATGGAHGHQRIRQDARLATCRHRHDLPVPAARFGPRRRRLGHQQSRPAAGHLRARIGRVGTDAGGRAGERIGGDGARQLCRARCRRHLLGRMRRTDAACQSAATRAAAARAEGGGSAGDATGRTRADPRRHRVDDTRKRAAAGCRRPGCRCLAAARPLRPGNARRRCPQRRLEGRAQGIFELGRTRTELRDRRGAAGEPDRPSRPRRNAARCRTGTELCPGRRARRDRRQRRLRD